MLNVLIRNMQIKTTMGITSHPSDDYFKKTKQEQKVTNVVVKDVEKLEALCAAGGNVNAAATVEDSMTFPQNIKNRINI